MFINFKAFRGIFVIMVSLIHLLSANTPLTVIDTVYVSNAGNPNDYTGYGQVNYDYYIGTYEVTNAEYLAFLNATASTDTHSLYNTEMSGDYGGIQRTGSSGSFTYSLISGRENWPVNFVNFWDAARFANWLTNGQPDGEQVDGVTENGMYDLNGVTHPTSSNVTRENSAWINGGVAIANENEWYKAAFYSGSPTGADGDGYWDYQTQSNSITSSEANFESSVGNLTEVGTYDASPSFYGTYDQGGNVWEWNENSSGNNRGILRGGAWGSLLTHVYHLISSTRVDIDSTLEPNRYGFRVSSLTPINLLSQTDSDDDGLSDYYENNISLTDPNNDDTDGDGLLDGLEVNTYNTSPTKPDSDGDTILDGIEVRHSTFGFDPNIDSSSLLDDFQQSALKMPDVLTDSQLNALKKGGVSLSQSPGNGYDFDLIIEESIDLIEWTEVDRLSHSLDESGTKKIIRVRSPE